jgi:NAD(P)-dependent dehydrogenase (short-subunit alcohol dehydrogenase family)
VTGGSRGIGRAIAHQLALEGADVVIAARNQEELRKTAAELTAATGRRIVPVLADTGDAKSVDALIAATAAELGGIDILVNNAAQPGGISSATKLEEIVDAEVLEDINSKVVVICGPRALRPRTYQERLGPHHQHRWLGDPSHRPPVRDAAQRRRSSDHQEPRG